MKKNIATLLSVSLILGSLWVTNAFVPSFASKMDPKNQSVVTDKYTKLTMADSIVIKNASQTLKVIDNANEIQAVIAFMKKNQYRWNHTWTNYGPTGQFAMEFFLVKDPLVTFGVEKRSVNFRNNAETYRCSMRPEEIDELKRIIGLPNL